MKEIIYFDRMTQSLEKEQVYGEFFLQFLYAQEGALANLAKGILFLLARLPFFSRLYGELQHRASSKKKVLPFIRKFQVDTKEFLDPVSSFKSFNDFFTRKLNLSYRPLVAKENVAILPADARYLVFPRIDQAKGFFVKGQTLSLPDLLIDPTLVQRYQKGSLVMARLCPVDYHRFHFPCDGTPEAPKLIQGPLFSVNPIALSRRLGILSENKRMITPLHTPQFGTILYIEVGATFVGSITQTHKPGSFYKKGDEKGFFSFGGSCILLLFEENRIRFDLDLITYSEQGIEVRALLGQSLGTAQTPHLS